MQKYRRVMNCMSENNCRRLEGQVAIVTGSAQGLGEALVKRLADEGCKVIVADINIDKACQVAEGLNDAIAVKVDVSDEEQVENMVKAAIDKYGKLDLFVSNAAILIAKSAVEFTAQEWKKMMEINLIGDFYALKLQQKL